MKKPIALTKWRMPLAWIVRINESALKELSRLGAAEQQTILGYLKQRIQNCENPKVFGKALRYTDKLWRYRVGKNRLICSIQDEIYTVLVIKIGKRDSVYK
jgi:mRNA interferase RelE/StbE